MIIFRKSSASTPLSALYIERAIVQPLEGDIATKINKTIIYLVRFRKGEERLYFIGRIELY